MIVLDLFEVVLDDSEKLIIELIVAFGELLLVKDRGDTRVPFVFLGAGEFQVQPQARTTFLMVKAKPLEHQVGVLSHRLRLVNRKADSKSTLLDRQSGEDIRIRAELRCLPVDQAVVPAS